MTDEDYDYTCELEAQVRKLQADLDAMRTEAVMFAKNTQRNGRWQEDEWNKANAFLARPDVQAWQERQKETT